MKSIFQQLVAARALFPAGDLKNLLNLSDLASIGLEGWFSMFLGDTKLFMELLALFFSLEVSIFLVFSTCYRYSSASFSFDSFSFSSDLVRS